MRWLRPAAAGALLLTTAATAQAQSRAPLLQVRTELRALVPVSARMSAEVHLNQYVNTRWGVSDEIKTGAGLEQAWRHFRLYTGYEHVVLRDTLRRHTEERGLVEATASVRPLDWLGLSDRQKTEIRDISGQFSTRWQNRVRADVGPERLAITPWVARELSYDTRYAIINRRIWWYGVRFNGNANVNVELFEMQEYDSRRAIIWQRATGVALRYHA
ncbi:MAG TPA: hypothetical protein VG818_01225 [Gemmatimonadaceae bacterium]|nr:hypothetical protein [Gemmatimonadaceae bacterium]